MALLKNKQASGSWGSGSHSESSSYALYAEAASSAQTSFYSQQANSSSYASSASYAERVLSFTLALVTTDPINPVNGTMWFRYDITGSYW